ncbi:hypothetical protein FN846DRAFT_981203 [Sphaerosporella brunnea]|uniref:Uncharacterized protein n=1 Tax=Sphaerosporella brunnea TaxID=1250544 RepID=A0A5J5EBL9_9PEZI|nr:hypothetical protein FN846DRAFT_981203 [Sphaerosporella brunnea]
MGYGIWGWSGDSSPLFILHALFLGTIVLLLSCVATAAQPFEALRWRSCLLLTFAISFSFSFFFFFFFFFLTFPCTTQSRRPYVCSWEENPRGTGAGAAAVLGLVMVSGF